MGDTFAGIALSLALVAVAGVSIFMMPAGLPSHLNDASLSTAPSPQTSLSTAPSPQTSLSTAPSSQTSLSPIHSSDSSASTLSSNASLPTPPSAMVLSGTSLPTVSPGTLVPLRRFHISETRIDHVNPMPDDISVRLKPTGLWYAYDEEAWVLKSDDMGHTFKGGYHVYEIIFSPDTKLFQIRGLDDLDAICQAITPGASIDQLPNWNMVSALYDGVEILPGAMDLIKTYSFTKTHDELGKCFLTIDNFDMDSGVVWNTDKIQELKYLGARDGSALEVDYD